MDQSSMPKIICVKSFPGAYFNSHRFSWDQIFPIAWQEGKVVFEPILQITEGQDQKHLGKILAETHILMSLTCLL